jgi:glycosyltransferase involved in cell wall biosynthesis
MPPVVSVILPTFNRLQFLPPAVESVFAQTFTDWELILADDGSDPKTRQYLQSVSAPPRVRVLWLAHSGKPAVVRNAALRAANGEYVAFLDSDDLWLPYKLERQIASLRRHPQRHWSYTSFVLVDTRAQPRESANRAWPAPSGWIIDRVLRDEIVIALPSVVVSRPLLQQLGAFDEELVMCEDHELWLRLALHSEIDGIEEPLTLVRRHAHHGGDDVTAWRDRRRVFEKALGASRDASTTFLLRRLRALMSAGLAQSQAARGMRAGMLRTLAGSAPHSWRYRGWWAGMLRALVRSFSPPALRQALHRYRSARLRSQGHA